jgi:hypothetical protein
MRRWLFEIHAWDGARRDKRCGLFAIRAVGHPIHHEWGPGPLISGIGPPSVVGQPGRQSKTPTTLKEVRDP